MWPQPLGVVEQLMKGAVEAAAVMYPQIPVLLMELS
jgi:hypothetical protein